jgi:hypothetical protein
MPDSIRPDGRSSVDPDRDPERAKRDMRPVREPTERRSYRDVDAFEIEDGTVMVCLAKPGHRIAEEFVPVADVERLREDRDDAREDRDALMAEIERLREALQRIDIGLTDFVENGAECTMDPQDVLEIVRHALNAS